MTVSVVFCGLKVLVEFCTSISSASVIDCVLVDTLSSVLPSSGDAVGLTLLVSFITRSVVQFSCCVTADVSFSTTDKGVVVCSIFVVVATDAGL